MCLSPGGEISYYPKSQRFECKCVNAAHGRCVLTRYAKPGTSGKFGRPLGRMAYWLLNRDQQSQVDHAYAPTPAHSDRQAARELLKEAPGAMELFRSERRQYVDAGEPEEPIEVEG